MRKLDRICQTIHPTAANGDVFGHDILKSLPICESYVSNIILVLLIYRAIKLRAVRVQRLDWKSSSSTAICEASETALEGW